MVCSMNFRVQAVPVMICVIFVQWTDVFGTGPIAKMSAHYQGMCGHYSPQEFIAAATVAVRRKYDCMLRCNLDLCCNSVKFEEPTGTCQLSQQMNNICSTNAKPQGTMFYRMRAICSNNWLYFQNSCFLFMPEIQVNRDDAAHLCRSFGAQLVSLQNEERRVFLSSTSIDILVAKGVTVADAKQKWWWSSGTRDPLEENWRDNQKWYWDNCEGQTLETFHPWAEDEPNRSNEDVIFLSCTGSDLLYLFDVGRSYLPSPICEYVP